MVSEDYEALESRRFLPGQMQQRFDLVAEFADVTSARRARQALLDAGVGAQNAAILGVLGEEVHTRSGLARDDTLLLGAAAWRIAIGGLAGALIGLVVNLVLDVEISGEGGAWMVILAGLVFGALVGALIGGMEAMRLGSTPENLHRRHAELDDVVLGVAAADADALRRAETALRRLGPVRLKRLTAPEGGSAATA